MKLANNIRVKKDLDRYTEAVNTLVDTKKKRYYGKILYEFTNLIQIIDQNHSSFTNVAVNPITLKDSVKELHETRLQLEQLCKSLSIK